MDHIGGYLIALFALPSEWIDATQEILLDLSPWQTAASSFLLLSFLKSSSAINRQTSFYISISLYLFVSTSLYLYISSSLHLWISISLYLNISSSLHLCISASLYPYISISLYLCISKSPYRTNLMAPRRTDGSAVEVGLFRVTNESESKRTFNFISSSSWKWISRPLLEQEIWTSWERHCRFDYRSPRFMDREGEGEFLHRLWYPNKIPIGKLRNMKKSMEKVRSYFFLVQMWYIFLDAFPYNQFLLWFRRTLDPAVIHVDSLRTLHDESEGAEQPAVTFRHLRRELEQL